MSEFSTLFCYFARFPSAIFLFCQIAKSPVQPVDCPNKLQAVHKLIVFGGCPKLEFCFWSGQMFASENQTALVIFVILFPQAT
jgi:hypothetical protein